MAKAADVGRRARKSQDHIVVNRMKKLPREKQKAGAGFSTSPVRETHTENGKSPVWETHTTRAPEKPALLSISGVGARENGGQDEAH